MQNVQQQEEQRKQSALQLHAPGVVAGGKGNGKCGGAGGLPDRQVYLHIYIQFTEHTHTHTHSRAATKCQA